MSDTVILIPGEAAADPVEGDLGVFGIATIGLDGYRGRQLAPS